MQEQHELMETLQAIFQRVSEQPLGRIDPDMSIAEMGIDSISLAEAIVHIEDTLSIQVPVGEWLRVRTFREVMEVVMQACANQSQATSL